LEVNKDALAKKPIPIGFFGVLRGKFFDVGWKMHWYFSVILGVEPFLKGNMIVIGSN